ncbi:MAG: hypothetical protein M3480_10230, partial [Verrucomicrobiota bacterium]|nr:hypothetical protein [Verrucomicrobiota bacterium]
LPEARGLVVSTALTPIRACAFWGHSSNLINTISVEEEREAGAVVETEGKAARLPRDRVRLSRLIRELSINFPFPDDVAVVIVDPYQLL